MDQSKANFFYAISRWDIFKQLTLTWTNLDLFSWVIAH